MKDSSEWRCSECDKLLGKLKNNRLHIRLHREHQYITGLPATSVCRGCKTPNELSSPHHGDRETAHM